MTVRYFYVDESHDDTAFCLSAIVIRHHDWRQCFAEVKAHRETLRDDFKISVRKEIHAHKFVGGRGDFPGIGKWQRSRIFMGMLQLIARLPHVGIFNVCLNTRSHADPQMVAWERLTNRIERSMLSYEQKEVPLRNKLLAKVKAKLSAADYEQLELRLLAYSPRAFIIADEGKERQITSALRRMQVYNPIPSQRGRWEDGSRTKNINTQRIIEDPSFKQSHASYFIQLADCVAYSLLKREVPPTPNIAKYGVDQMFEKILGDVCVREACRKDPLGIVR